MKIDIDLSEIFVDGDEGGDVNQSIKDIIIDTVCSKIYGRINKEITDKISSILEKGITEKLNAYLSNLIPMLMEYEFEETGYYGASKAAKTTVKNRILKTLETQCVFSERGSYNSDNNAFTKSVKEIIEKQMKEYKPAFDKQVNALFVKEAMDYAVAQVKKKLGIA